MVRHARLPIRLAVWTLVLGAARVAVAADPEAALDTRAVWRPDPPPRPAAVAPVHPVRVDTVARAESLGTATVDYLWVLRGSLASRASIDSVLARASRIKVRGLLVQVVGRGDACYRSDILPRAEFIDRREGPAFDPLGELLERAHARGLEVHAWVNCLLVWSAPRWPRDPRHVVNAHPEWIAQLKGGRSMVALGPRERERRGVEGMFLSAGHPGVRAWVVSVAREIAERYDVDGIHLDYIRDPNVEVGFDPTTRARFALENGVDPDRFGELTTAERARVESKWKSFRREQVTGIVQAVRDSVLAVRPGVLISAAVISDTTRAERSNAQMWRSWLRDGLIDRAFLMCYAVPVQTVMGQLLAFVTELGPGRVVPGIAMYNTGPQTAALKIKGARALGYSRIALYSYDSLFGERHYWDALERQFPPGTQGNR